MTPTTTSSSGGTMSAETLIKAAHLVLDNCGITMSPSKVSRIVRTYQRQVAQNGFSFFAFLTNAVQLSADQQRSALADSDIARVISYADPTGERAVNNVAKGRSATPSRPACRISGQAAAPLLRAEDFVPDPRELEDIYAMTDGISDEQFEEALRDARAEGDLSRSNVVRKCKAMAAR